MSSERKSTAEMVGDTLRRAGLIMVVFGAFDLAAGSPGKFWGWWMVAGAFLSALGVMVERVRHT